MIVSIAVVTSPWTGKRYCVHDNTERRCFDLYIPDERGGWRFLRRATDEDLHWLRKMMMMHVHKESN